jgi:DNA-binding HxlR family transcriptional regulator
MTTKLEIEILSVLPQDHGLFDNELAQRIDPEGNVAPLKLNHALKSINQQGFAKRSIEAPDDITKRPYYRLTELGRDVLESLDPTN